MHFRQGLVGSRRRPQGVDEVLQHRRLIDRDIVVIDALVGGDYDHNIFRLRHGDDIAIGRQRYGHRFQNHRNGDQEDDQHHQHHVH